jgi:LytS/YehU family sensor histidine kinase
MDTTLSEELERLKLYLTLEQMRFQQKFSYEILIDESINTDEVMLPAMMLQPFLENSIWHGILPSEKNGQIDIRISQNNASWKIIIDDDGVGIETSLGNKEKGQSAHASHGMDITMNRVRLYRNMTGLNYQIEGPFERKDEKDQILGTRVIVDVPKKPFLD